MSSTSLAQVTNMNITDPKLIELAGFNTYEYLNKFRILNAIRK